MEVSARYINKGRELRVEDMSNTNAWVESDMNCEQYVHIRSGGSFQW
jgi:hypothetical protein